MKKLVVALALLATGLGANAFAQSYPSRQITLIVPFPPGGSTDILARALAGEARTALNQEVVVITRAGASGVAVSFVNADTEAHFRLIEKRQGLRVPREQVPGFEMTQTEPTAASALRNPLTDPEGTGGIKGKRKSKKDKLREAAAQASSAKVRDER